MFPLQDNIPRRNPPFAVWALVFLNVVFFLFEISLPPQTREAFLYTFGVVPLRHMHPEWAQAIGLPVDSWIPFLTSMFLHGGWIHLIGNMWFLLLFGDNVEDRMGSFRFIIFYLLCGFISGGVHTLISQESTVPAIGASGAISGILAAYLILYPRARIITMIPVFFYPFFFEIPATVFIGLWFVLQLGSGITSLFHAQAGGGIAWWAHVGGFAAGILLLPFFCTKRCRTWHTDEFTWDKVWGHRR